MTLEEIKNICENAGFEIYESNDMFGKGEPGWELGQTTPCGEDWHEVLASDDVETLIKALETRVDNWDSDEEIQPWISSAGKNGVPKIRELLDDADWKETKLKDLLNSIKNNGADLNDNKLQEADDTENSDDEIEQIENEETKNLDDLIQKWEEKSPLHERVISEIVEDSEDYDGTKLDKIKSRLDEISDGLVSGTVGSLIYYSDTTKFFDDYYDDIWDEVQNLVNGGLEPIKAIEQHCDETEMLMGSDNVKNWVVWMVYEEIAYEFQNELEML